MSLDIYGKLKHNYIPCGQQLGTAYRMWSRQEREALTDVTRDVLWINITHNLGEMASNVPIHYVEFVNKRPHNTYDTNLYYIMWRPDELFTDKKYIKLKDVVRPLEVALHYILSHEKELSKYNPENGWGHYENFVHVLPEYIRACYKWPNATLAISR